MSSPTPGALSPELEREFRSGFYANRPADWIEHVQFQGGAAALQVERYLEDIARGERNFAYPGHDEAVFNTLTRIVPKHGLRVGADVGCASGCFPAMQLAAGIERCTVFEIRPLEIAHPRIEVRIQDLSAIDELAPEFDLVTCLSTIEHVGLGRYGDALDPWGDIGLARGIRQIVRPGGFVLMSFPVGKGCVVYNLHRIYNRYRCGRLFEGFEVVGLVSDHSLLGRVRYEARRLRLGRRGVSRQPIFVLRPRA